MYTEKYWEFRVSQLVDCLAAAIIELYPHKTNNHCGNIDILRNRLLTRDYVHPAEANTTRLGYHIKLAKRLTRFYIKTAIEHSPAWKTDHERRVTAYNNEKRRLLKINPTTEFFSFQGSKYGSTKLQLKEYAHLFRIASEKDIEEAKEFAKTFEKV